MGHLSVPFNYLLNMVVLTSLGSIGLSIRELKVPISHERLNDSLYQL